MYFSARTEGRISYGHLGRTNLFYAVMRLTIVFAILYCIVFIADIASVLNLGGVYNNDSTSIRPRDRDDHWTTYICAAYHTDISGMVDNTDDKLLHKILNNASHVLSMLLPERRNELTYLFVHASMTGQRATRLTDNNFITRQLFKNSY